MVDLVLAIEAGRLVVDPGAHEVTFKGRRLTLTPREFDPLAFLAKHPARVTQDMCAAQPIISVDTNEEGVVWELRQSRRAVAREGQSPRGQWSRYSRPFGAAGAGGSGAPGFAIPHPMH